MKKVLLVLLVITIFLGGFHYFLKIYDENSKFKTETYLKEKDKKQEKENLKEKEKKYKQCMNTVIDSSLLSLNFQNKVKDVNDFLNNYHAYVSYSELADNYYYGYNDNKIIYGASLIKLVDALYILDNNINIDLTLKYSSKYYNKYNKGLINHTVGDNIAIDMVVKHALAVSDNGAHKMLIDYIGFNNLKSYGKSLGAKVILTGGDNFGMQTARDTNIYLTRLYNLLRKNNNASKFKEYMINDFHSYLNVDNLEVAHKYGYYQDNFHDIGIIFDEHPYAISILTKYGNNDYATKIKEISLKINELHKEFWVAKELYCQSIK